MKLPKSVRVAGQVVRILQEDLSDDGLFGYYSHDRKVIILAKDLKDKIILGQQSEAVWNKDFKMRITSKKTGRKIDINLNFKTRHIRSDAENE